MSFKGSGFKGKGKSWRNGLKGKGKAKGLFDASKINRDSEKQVPGTLAFHEAQQKNAPLSCIVRSLTTAQWGNQVPKRVLTVDIDGSIADTDARENHAAELTGQKTQSERNARFFDEFLRGDLYHMDSPVEGAVDFLGRYVAELGGDLVYLSGRRAGTERDTQTWLREHSFPLAPIVHRFGGPSGPFKKNFILALKKYGFNVDGHIGDRPTDDGGAARDAGVRFIEVSCTQWPTIEEAFGDAVRPSHRQMTPHFVAVEEPLEKRIRSED